MRRMRLPLLVGLPVAAFALVFAGTLGYYRLVGDSGPAARSSSPGPGRLVLALGVQSNEPVEAYLASVALDGFDVRPITAAPDGSFAADFSPSVSPDGATIAFTRAIPGEPPFVHLVGMDGSGLRRLTDGRGAEISPAWSPDGTRIAFAREVKGRFDLFVCAADGSGLTQLTHTPKADDDMPTWTPDGLQVTYTRFADDDENVWVVDSDGSNARAFLVGEHEDSSPAWSPDGARIAFVRDGRIAIFGGETVELITDGGSLKDAGPSWSPDGSRIVFTRDPGSVFVVGPDGVEPTLVPLDARATGAVWVPGT